MYRRLESGTAARTVGAMTVACLVGWSAVSIAQTSAPASKTVPDAQVEANVLKALAGASDLANQPITTTTVYGVVTLSGTVQTEALRTEAETITSRTAGVQKVVDEMTLSSDGANNAAPVGDGQGGSVLQSDGTMAPAPPADNAAPGQQPMAQGPASPDNTQPGAPEYRQPYNGPHAPLPDVYAQQNGYPAQTAPQQPGYSQPQQPGYGQPQQPGYGQPQQYAAAPQQVPYGGQEPGQPVTIPNGAWIRMRINQTLDSNRTQAGAKFDGIVVNDVVADGAVAIPRGAAVQGTVVDVKRSGALKGRGELSLQLTQVTLAGKNYPLVSNIWTHNGANKTTETVNRTVIGGGIGALIGAAAGGGAGAAIGAGVGGALGLGSSAASPNGELYIPAEGLLSFQLAQPANVATVSQQEMDRLAQGVFPGGAGQPLRRRAYAYPGYGPGYYPPPNSPYPY